MELLEAYIQTALQTIPPTQQTAVQQRLWAEIDQRVMAFGPDYQQEAAIRCVLTELGDPHELAERLMQTKRALIGPYYLPTYLQVLKILALIIFLAVNALSLIRGLIYELTAWQTVSFVVTTLVQVLLPSTAIVTIVFAIFESRNLDLAKLSRPEAKAASQVPAKALAISRFDASVAILVTSVFFGFLLSNPSLSFLAPDQQVESVITLFQEPLFSQTRWLLVASVMLGIGQELLKLRWGAWNWQRGLMNSLFAVLSVGFGIGFFSTPAIWNDTFANMVATVSQFELIFLVNSLMVIVICVTLLECLQPFFKVYRYTKTEKRAEHQG